MNDSDLLNEMRRLAGAVPQAASPDVEDRLRAEFRGRQTRKTPLWIYAAVAACAAFVLGLIFMRPARIVTPHAERVYTVPGFIALPYAQSGVPIEQAVVVRVRIPASRLSAMGVPVPAAAGAGRVNAEVLVGQDGVARAVRLVE